jgi:aminoglycoside/choline kinase family phosphotransferase
LLFDNTLPLLCVQPRCEENEAFFYFTRFFLEKNIPVPEIFAIDKNKNYYLLEDLGDESLFSYLSQHREGEHLPEHVLSYYEKVIKQLPLLQLSGTQGMDFNICYPRQAFDRQSMQWDLNYFKYYFLKLVQIPFDEQLLENDFNTLISFLLEADNHYFMFRDFQSRNIMLRDEQVFFIDYQGGRKGALQYDIASLYTTGRQILPPKSEHNCSKYIWMSCTKYIPVNRNLFKQHYQGFVLIRILQALGTYGFRGFTRKKAIFC